MPEVVFFVLFEPEAKYLHVLMILAWTRKGKQYSVPQLGLATGVQTFKFFRNKSLKPSLTSLYLDNLNFLCAQA